MSLCWLFINKAAIYKDFQCIHATQHASRQNVQFVKCTHLTWLSQNLVFWGRLSSTVRAVASTGSAWEVVPDISSSALR